MKKNLLLLIGLLFSLVGLVFAAIGVGTGLSTYNFEKTALRASGVVVEMHESYSRSSSRSRSHSRSYTYRPVVEFTDSSGAKRRFQSKMGSNPPAYRVGESVNVLYDPQNPAKGRIDSAFEKWMFPLIFGGMGSVFFLLGIGFIIYMVVRKGRSNKALTQGVAVQARIAAVGMDPRYKINGRSPYKITAQWQNPATGLMHMFESEAIWFNPQDYLKGETITVYVVLDDPKCYSVDISFLPRQA